MVAPVAGVFVGAATFVGVLFKCYSSCFSA